MFSPKQFHLLKTAAISKQTEYKKRSSLNKKEKITLSTEPTDNKVESNQSNNIQVESSGSLNPALSSTHSSNDSNSRIPKFHKSIFKSKYLKRIVTPSRNTAIRKAATQIVAEGHRGSGHIRFENSLESFSRAIEVGLHSIELDVWFTSDRQILVVHGDDNDMIELIDGSKRLITSMTYAETLELVLLPNGQTMPLLLDVLELCKDKVHVNVEIKGKEEELVAGVVDLVISKGMLSQVHVSSFMHEHAIHLKKALMQRSLDDNAIYFGYLVWKTEELDGLEKLLAVHENIQTCIVAFPVEFIYEEAALEYLLRAKNRGATLSCYFDFDVIEVDSIYARLTQIGVKTIISNQPNTLLRFLKNA